jgi:membrane-bound ClpP family serine protease
LFVQAPRFAENRHVFSSRQRHNSAIGIIASGCLAVVGSVVGIIARHGPIFGVIGLLGIALLIRGVTLRARLKREEAIPPRD